MLVSSLGLFCLRKLVFGCSVWMCVSVFCVLVMLLVVVVCFIDLMCVVILVVVFF